MKNYKYPTWLVSLDIAQELKEIGFDEPCTFAINYTQYIEPFLVQHRNKGYNAVFYGEVRMLKYETLDKDLLDKIAIIPTWEQVFEWFREKGMFHSICIVEDLLEGVKYFETEIRDNNGDIICILHRATYEEAREALVKALIRTYKSEQLK